MQGGVRGLIRSLPRRLLHSVGSTMEVFFSRHIITFHSKLLILFDFV